MRSIEARRGEDVTLDGEEHNKEESKSEGSPHPSDEEERQKMHNDLHNCMDKYEEMDKKIGTLSFVDSLLSSIDLPYDGIVMEIIPLRPKFKVPSIKLCDGLKDPIKHLKPSP